MQIFEKPEAVIVSYPFRSLGDPDQFLFFDIETTGLGAGNAQVYLIGALTHSTDAGWVLRQWFADGMTDESELLRSFFDYAKGFRTLVHYNGDSFDIPFLLNCAAQYRIPHPFSGMNSLDLYRAVRPYRNLFPTERMNQKSMERFLGIFRADRYTGGELISVYHSYTASRSTALLQQLLLHNEEDLTALPGLLSLLAYRDTFLGTLKLTNFQNADDAVTMEFLGKGRVPVPVSKMTLYGELSLSEDLLRLRIPYHTGTFTHYFENYRDYYYLPLEDRAVHKSLGEFVDRSARIRATARTACVRKEGRFLPLPGAAPEGLTVFQEEYRGAVRYADAGEIRLDLPANAEAYAEAFLRAAGLRDSG